MPPSPGVLGLVLGGCVAATSASSFFHLFITETGAAESEPGVGVGTSEGRRDFSTTLVGSKGLCEEGEGGVGIAELVVGKNLGGAAGDVDLGNVTPGANLKSVCPILLGSNFLVGVEVPSSGVSGPFASIGSVFALSV